MVIKATESMFLIGHGRYPNDGRSRVFEATSAKSSNWFMLNTNKMWIIFHFESSDYAEFTVEANVTSMKFLVLSKLLL